MAAPSYSYNNLFTPRNPSIQELNLEGLNDEEKKRIKEVVDKEREFTTIEHDQKFKGRQMDGQLSKFTNLMKGWQYRWFVLDPEGGNLSYYLDKEKIKLGPRGSVPLAGAVIAPSEEDSSSFSVNACNGEVYKLRAINAKERQHWITMIRAVAEYHSSGVGTKLQTNPVTRSHSFGETIAKTFSIKSNTGIQSHSLAPDEKRLSVTASCSPKTRRAFEPPKPPPNPVKDELKNVKDALNSVDEYHAAVVETIENSPQTIEVGGALDENALLLKATSQAMANVLHQCYTILQHQVSDIQKSAVVSGLPPGATIEWIEPNQPTTELVERRHSAENVENTEPVVNCQSSGVEEIEVEETEVDFRLINQYEQEEVEDTVDSETSERDENMEKHRSLILHLISQAKLGMDLTRVPLPIFILEKRSLLEMYADFFKHAQLFLSIPKCPSPEERMKAVLEFYLTTFHSGRKTKAAKKPYNPILGETFHCSFDSSIPNQTPNQEGSTVSGSGKSSTEDLESQRLFFVAEQVSHHPPISAFYAESANKEICMNAHIWTKSKFYGMSIGVINVGEGVVSIPKEEEDYIVTFPNAYCRSILTHPWVELGGRTVIKCAKTGYAAVVTFHTKPFYGNSEQVGRITGEIKHLPTQQVWCTVSGHWNGSVTFSYTNGERADHTVDVNAMPLSKKRVRPLPKQKETESRSLWHKVTTALEKGDLDAASAAKHALEENQRSEEKERQLSGKEWTTKLFRKHGDGWIFNGHMIRQRTRSRSPTKPFEPSMCS